MIRSAILGLVGKTTIPPDRNSISIFYAHRTPNVRLHQAMNILKVVSRLKQLLIHAVLCRQAV